MSSFNRVILMGRLVRDPELRATPSGLQICKFGIAVNRKYSTKDGEQREEVTYVDIDAFGRQAETIAKYLTKGDPIHIEGRLKIDQWETKEGDKRSRLGVVLEGFQFIGSREGGQGGGQGDKEPPAGAQQPQREVYNAETDDSDDEYVPF